MVGRGPQPPIQADKSAGMRLESLKKTGIRAGALFARKTMFMNMEKKRNLTKSEHRRWCAGGSRNVFAFLPWHTKEPCIYPVHAACFCYGPFRSPPKPLKEAKKHVCSVGSCQPPSF